MGGSGSKVEYHDNSAQVNQSLNNIRNQLAELDKDIGHFKDEIDTHVESVQNKFTRVDNKILCVQNEFVNSFNYLDYGIKIIGDNIKQMSMLQIEYEQTNMKEHWEIFQNDWKENCERLFFQEYQKIKNLKLELESELNHKVSKYLLLKDQFNQKIQIYNNKKRDYQLMMLLNHLNLNPSTNANTHLELELFQPNSNVNLNELLELKNSIGLPPNLDQEVIQLFEQVNRFEEIVELEKDLESRIKNCVENFHNPNLVNPLNDNLVKPEILAQKLHSTGIITLGQICFQNQNQLLISNGFAYIPDYKYDDLRKKFISGCEKSGLKLNWEQENICLISKYLYAKTNSKSVSTMIEYALNSTDSIYHLEQDKIVAMSKDEKNKFIGFIGFQLYSNLNLTKAENKFELKYEKYQIIFYQILKNKNIMDLNIINNELLVKLNYTPMTPIALILIKQIMLSIDSTYDDKFFINQYEEEFGIEEFDVWVEQLSNYVLTKYAEYLKNNKIGFKINTTEQLTLSNYILTKYFDNPTNNKNGFRINTPNPLIMKEFVTHLSLSIIKKYFENILNIMKNDLILSIDLNEKELHELISNIEINQQIFKIISKNNQIQDIKMFIAWTYTQIYNYCWN